MYSIAVAKLLFHQADIGQVTKNEKAETFEHVTLINVRNYGFVRPIPKCRFHQSDIGQVTTDLDKYIYCGISLTASCRSISFFALSRALLTRPLAFKIHLELISWKTAILTPACSPNLTASENLNKKHLVRLHLRRGV